MCPNITITTAYLTFGWFDCLPILPALSVSCYTQVFTDFMAGREKKGLLLRYLPTPVYLYGMSPGDKFEMMVPLALAQHSALCHLTEQPAVGGGTETVGVSVSVELKRVGPLKAGSMRSVVFGVNGREQTVEVKDSSGKFEFTG